MKEIKKKTFLNLNLFNLKNLNEIEIEMSQISIGITIVELAFAEQCRDLAPNANFNDRLKRAQNFARKKSHKLPRFI